MSAFRASSADDAGAITPTMVMDWSRLTGNQIRREEYEMIVTMDIEFRKALSIERQNNSAIMNKDSESAWT